MEKCTWPSNMLNTTEMNQKTDIHMKDMMILADTSKSLPIKLLTNGVQLIKTTQMLLSVPSQKVQFQLLLKLTPWPSNSTVKVSLHQLPVELTSITESWLLDMDQKMDKITSLLRILGANTGESKVTSDWESLQA